MPSKLNVETSTFSAEQDTLHLSDYPRWNSESSFLSNRDLKYIFFPSPNHSSFRMLV